MHVIFDEAAEAFLRAKDTWDGGLHRHRLDAGLKKSQLDLIIWFGWQANEPVGRRNRPVDNPSGGAISAFSKSSAQSWPIRLGSLHRLKRLAWRGPDKMAASGSS
jgi:hypothetical protein